MNCCRLCSSMTHNAVAIFGDEGVQMKLAYKINKCLPLLVTLSDKLPRHVCRECVAHLDSTSKFITKCLHTQFILEKKLKGREYIPSDEVSVLWSNVNSESTDVPSAIQPSGKGILVLVTGNNSHEDDSHDYGSPLNSPAATDEIEIINEGESSEKSADNRAQWNKVVRVAPLSGANEKSKDSNSNVIQEKINHNFREMPQGKTMSFVSPGIDMSGNKENNVASEQGSTNLKELSLSRFQKKYICKYCNSSFLWRAELFYHQTTSHPAYVFRCRYCLKVFYDSHAEYTKHVAAHKVNEEPKLAKKREPVSELSLLKQNASLCMKYNIKTLEESTHKKKPEPRKEAKPEKRMRESNSHEKPIMDVVVKNLLERKTGGKLLGGADNQPGLIDLVNPKTYKCEWCPNEVQTEEEHHIHLRFFHRLRYPCRLCPRTFNDRKILLYHEAKHVKEKKYKCRKCNIEFDTEEERKDHKKFHLKENAVTCKICGEKFASILGLHQHSQIHAEAETFLCHRCGKALKYKTSLRLHMKSCGVDPETAKKNVCRYCGKRYLVPSRLRIHERVHTGEKPFMCSLCGKTFHSKERLRNHSLTHVVDNVPCPICGFVMKHEKQLKGHMKSHERVQCKTCGLWFEGPRKLGCHQRVHKKAQVVKDDGGVVMVSKRNVEEENLNESQMMVRFPVVIELSNPSFQDEVPDSIDNSSKIFQQLQKPFACPHCPMKFVLHQSYLKHVKQQHSSTNAQNRKPLYCPDCGGKSQSMDELVRHYYTHFVGSRFYCDVCGESFDRKILMIEHKRTHGTNIGPVGDTLLRKRLLRLQPREPLAIPSNSKSDFAQVSIQEHANHVVVGNPECDGGDYLTFDTHSVDSHCSEVIVVSSENMT